MYYKIILLLEQIMLLKADTVFLIKVQLYNTIKTRKTNAAYFVTYEINLVSQLQNRSDCKKQFFNEKQIKILIKKE